MQNIPDREALNEDETKNINAFFSASSALGSYMGDTAATVRLTQTLKVISIVSPFPSLSRFTIYIHISVTSFVANVNKYTPCCRLCVHA